MTSEESNDKLDGIIQFFVRERESKIHYITFGKENSASIYANFLAAIAIVIIIPSIVESDIIEASAIIFVLLVGIFLANVVISIANMLQIADYKSTTHKFDVIISCLQVSKISDKSIETLKLIKLMEERPKGIVCKNNLYKTWLNNVFDYTTKHTHEENTHQEAYIGNSG